MGCHSQRLVGLAVLVMVASACSAGVTNGADTFGGVTVATTKADDPADTGGDESTDVESTAASADGGEGGEATTAATSQGTAGDETATGAPVGECGDGIVGSGETCDGRELAGSCADYGFEGGVLACDPECNHITDACFTCGDGEMGLGEACDGDEFGGASCVSLGFGSGALQCSVDCQTVIDSGCVALPSCGDGQLNGGEACDGANLGGNSCLTQGFDLGTISCTASCTLDVSNCEDDLAGCGMEGDFCLFDENDLQSTCCPAGVGGNVLGICNVFVCV